MTMLRADLQAIVAKFGEPRIVAIIFDNSGRKLFKHEDFSLSMIDPDVDYVFFTEKDIRGTEYVVYKNIGDIQGLIILPEGVNKLDYVDMYLQS